MTKEIDLKHQYISEAEYAFQKILELCVKAFKEKKEEGDFLFKKVIKFVIGGYHIIANPRHNIKVLSLEKKIRIMELRKYIKENFIKDLIYNLSVYMVKEIPFVSFRI